MNAEKLEKLKTPEIKPIKKILIANRGEIAVRAAKTCEKRGIAAVIPYSTEDEDALVVKIGEKNIGRGWELAPLGGKDQEDSYANSQKMLQSAELYECDAIFLGYGFLSENADFVKACEDKKIRVLAPPGEIMRRTGNKIEAKDIAKKIKIGRFSTMPILAGSTNLRDVNQTISAADHLGFPVVLKDPDAGGGAGNLVARNQEELVNAFGQMKINETKQIFMERYIQKAVHLEIQIAADKHGNVVSLGERDCTLQRKSQKIIEESPSPNISDRTRRIIREATKRYAREIGYSGIGTWEFIVDLDKKGKGQDPAWYFMEINPRIQVEHAVTEEQTGIDIIDLMINIAEGKSLPFTQDQIDKKISPKSHTIEARIYAEDPNNNFIGSSGELSTLMLPKKNGIRIETGYEEGDRISAWYDKIVCKIICKSESRQDATEKLLSYLGETKIAGVPTNREMVIELLDTLEFRQGKVTTTFIEQWWNKRTKEQAHNIAEFINEGTFTPHQPTYKLDVNKLPQDIAVPSRKENRLVKYSQHLEEEKKKTGKESAAEFGILERDGVKFVLYYLDYSFKAGTLGIAEGLAFRDACALSGEANLPLVTICSSGGIRQEENTLALNQMSATINALNKYRPPLYINVYTGPVYGGVPASFAGVADLQIAVDSPETKIGFSGPYIVARSQGKEPKSFKAKDAYEELPQGAHTPVRHYQHRNVDMLVPNLAEASNKVVHLLHILKLPATITDPHIVYKPKESIGLTKASSMARRFDQPENFVHAWWGKLRGVLWERHKSPPAGELILPEYEKLSVNKRLEILTLPERPTAADLIDVNSGLFDDVVLLSNPPLSLSNAEQYQPIIGALVRINKESPLLVLAQETQRVRDPITHKWKKDYDPQKPQDWEYAQRIIKFGKKLKLPLFLIGDTLGADCRVEAEDRNQSHRIGQMLEAVDRYNNPVLSVNIGFKGSGGGETFIKCCDAAAAFENSLFAVSSYPVQYWIMTGRWIDGSSAYEEQKELQDFIEQLNDARAEVQLRFKTIDSVIPEGKGGAHQNPYIVTRYLRSWIIEQLISLKKLREEELLNRRDQRTLETATVAAVLNL